MISYRLQKYHIKQVSAVFITYQRSSKKLQGCRHRISKRSQVKRENPWIKSDPKIIYIFPSNA